MANRHTINLGQQHKLTDSIINVIINLPDNA